MNLSLDIFERFIGQTVRTYIYHSIFGNHQATICGFQPLCTEDKIGFVVGEQEIFLYTDEVEFIDQGKTALTINGILQSIKIELVE